ncbi:uncharacterized protein LOC105830373 isoform X1 [Monomorium pharaonis]|uniref:uncharacterized protein LOC105830373 isoform X1 n=1 Tax=Monomorium pharaonis TaxID=307658 RepID=UPI0017462657|nr:uncharacterized protein LOC105830373 isoform X1 [Monomorium pharaonis]XP_036141166.1 uncharacterized protein LOC105830373 isoform X1 [Monomorium pharaonis]
MFAYVKFEDGHKTIVETSDIKHFKRDNINHSKKYKVRWDDAFYDALIIDVNDSKQKLEEKIASKRPKIPLFEKCLSASESELESSFKENKRNTKMNTKETKKKNITNVNTSNAILKANKHNETTKEMSKGLEKSIKGNDVHSEALKKQIRDLKLQNDLLRSGDLPLDSRKHSTR